MEKRNLCWGREGKRKEEDECMLPAPYSSWLRRAKKREGEKGSPPLFPCFIGVWSDGKGGGENKKSAPSSPHRAVGGEKKKGGEGKFDPLCLQKDTLREKEGTLILTLPLVPGKEGKGGS